MSKSNSKGSTARIGTLLEQLQKLCLAGSEAKYEQEKVDVEQLRYVTNKIQQLLSSQEKCRKDLMTKFTDGISTLLVVLEMSVDTQLTLNILSCLCELLTTGKRASVLAAKGTVDIILRVIVSASKEASVCEEILLLSHVILTKVGPKDRKLCVKARLTGALQVTMNVVKNNTTFFKVLQPALQVLKLYSANSVNCNALAKSGAVSVLFRVVTSCGHKRVICLKLVLEIIATLVKSKSCASKAVTFGAVPVLLHMFCDWQRTDHHHRQTNIRKAILNVIKNITMSRAGKKAFIQADGIKTLYTLSLETLECRELEGVNNLSSQILRRCFPTNKLPVSTLSSRLAFSLLDLDSASHLAAEDLLDDSGEGESSEVESEEDEEEGSSASQDDKEAPAVEKSEKPDSKVPVQNKYKPRDDLAMYEKFFPELFEIQVEDAEPMEDEMFVSCPIVIPTAAEEPLSTSPTGPSQLSNQLDSMNVDSPPTQSEASQPKTQAATTQEELTEEDRLETDGSAVSNGQLHSVLPIIKIPSSDVYGHYPPVEPEPLGQKKTGLQRTMIFKDIERQIHPQRVINKVVFDLDSILKQAPDVAENCLLSVAKEQLKLGHARKPSNSSMSEGERSSPEETARPLKFESRFESGNLRKAIQVRDCEYDLVLNPDINCKHHHQWFYFEVSNMDPEIPYKFNIVNCEKINSQFNFGMQPVMYSTIEAQEGRAGWVRAGTNVCYYRNYFTRSREATGGQGGKTYYTSTFTVTFPHRNDVCYFAYHYPYTFTMLQGHLSRLESSLNSSDIYYRRMTLCNSLAGNPCDVITITAQPRRRDAKSLEILRNRPYVFLTSRVHPGESNSSWVMKGVLDFLMSNFYTARHLRETFIFKIVPMLNMDGVINGCHRCSLSGDDLNRRWIYPSMLLHPTIYHVKGLLLYLQSIEKTPLVYCDFHGHSRKKNVFMYGCSTAATIAANSSSSGDVDSDLVDSVRERVAELSGSDSTSSMDPSDIDEDPGYRTLPRVLHNIAPAFSLGSCSFIVEQSKESTARVVVWREIGVVRSYTMESTYSGCDQGPYKGYHVGTRELEEMGRFFCAGLLRVGRSYFYRNNHAQMSSNDSTNEVPTADSTWIRTSELFVPCELVRSGVVI